MPIGSLSILIKGDISQFNKDIASVEKQLNKQTRGLQTVARSMTSVGDSMTKGVTLPIMAVGAVLAKVGTEFDDAYDKIRIGTGATGKALDGLKDDFKEVAKDSASSFDDISTAISEYNTRLGLTGKPLQDLSKQITNVSRITETDLNANITQSAKLFNNWKIATENQNKTLDLMFVASQQTGIGIDKLMTSVTDYGPVLRGMGYDLESATALIAGFDKAGVNVQETLATMKIAMKNLAKEGFTDPQEALAMYIDKIKNAGSDIEATGIAAELFGSRGGAVMSAAIRDGRLNLDDLINSLKASKETINGVADATDDWKEKLTKLKNETMVQLEPVANKVFDSIGRSVEKITPKIEKLTEWFGNLTESQTDNILKWGLILAAIGPVLSIVGRTTTGIIQLRTAILTLNTAINSSPLLMGTLATAAVAALGWATDKAGDSIDNLSDSIGNKLGATAVRTIIPIGQLKHGIEENIAVAKALREGYLSADEAAHINIFTIDKYLKLIEERKAAEEDITEKEIPSYIEAISQKDSSENINIITLKKHKKAAEDDAGVIEEQTEDINDQIEAIEELRNEYNDLIDTIFEHITTYNDFEEAGWAVEEAEKALTEAIKEYGKESVEAKKAQNNLDDAMIENIKIAFELSTSIDATTKQQEEARKKAVELGLEYVASGQIGVDAFVEMAKQFDVSSGEIIKWAEEMDIELDEATKERIIRIGLDTSGFDSSLSAAINRLNNLDRRMGLSGGAMGGLITPHGVVQSFAAGGMVLPQTGRAIPILAHAGEMILNSSQQSNLIDALWGVANGREVSKDRDGDININFNKPVYINNGQDIEDIASELAMSIKTKQIGTGIR